MTGRLIEFLKEQRLGAFEQGVIRLISGKPDELGNIAAVRKRVEEFLPAEGWISYTDSVDAFRETDTIKPDRHIVAAELTNGRSSLHIRQSGKGWTAVELVKENGEGVIVTDMFIARKDKASGMRMKYETCWQVQDSPVKDGAKGGAKAYQPVVSRFVGFVKEGE